MENVVFGWTKMPIGLLLSTLSPEAKLLYVYLRWRQGDNESCWPSQNRIASDLGMTRWTVMRKEAELDKAGWVTVMRENGRANSYMAHEQPVAQMPQEVAPVQQGCSTSATPTCSTGATHELDTMKNKNHELSAAQPVAEKKPRQHRSKSASRKKGNSQHGAMFTALARITQTDVKNKRNQGWVNAEAAGLLESGWLPDDMERFLEWWLADDWRRKHTPVPSIKAVRERILQALRPADDVLEVGR